MASSTATEGEFPWITSADTRIVIANNHALNLQSAQLRAQSSTFRRLIPNSARARLGKVAQREGARTELFLVLQQVKEKKKKKRDTEEQAGPKGLGFVLELLVLEHRGLPLDEDAAEGLPEEFKRMPVAEAFFAVLGCFYGVKIDLGIISRATIDTVFVQCETMVKVAEYLDCIQLITEQLKGLLLANPRTTTLVHRAMSTSPVPWLSLTYRLKSRALFAEALIHATGQWNTELVQARAAEIKPELVILLGKKGEILRQQSQDAYIKVMGYYPLYVTREKTYGVVAPKSNDLHSYRGDICVWFALTIWREWATQAMAQDETHHAPDMGWAFWDRIERGGDAYLDAEALTRWHETFPMSGMAPRMVREELGRLKEEVKKCSGVSRRRVVMTGTAFRGQVVEANNEKSLLMERALLKSTVEFPLKYYTSAVVSEEDFLWIEEDRLAEEKRRKDAEDDEDEDEEMEDQ